MARREGRVTVIRWRLDPDHVKMVEDRYGIWVRHDDAYEVCKERDALRAELDQLRKLQAVERRVAIAEALDEADAAVAAGLEGVDPVEAWARWAVEAEIVEPNRED